VQDVVDGELRVEGLRACKPLAKTTVQTHAAFIPERPEAAGALAVGA
jgi:hypothetical protein